MNQCKFAKKSDKGDYIYGFYVKEEEGTPKEKVVQINTGRASTIEEALRLNDMVLSGKVRIGVNPSDLIWRNLND